MSQEPKDEVDENDGPITKLAKRMFASPDSPFTAFADRQRVERLENCRQLEIILKACQSEHKRLSMGSSKEDVDTDKLAAEANAPRTTKSGVKIARFFNWDSPHSNGLDANGSKSNSHEMNNEISSFSEKEKVGSSLDCARETHELWACRALALGCGNHLSDLRRCWNEANLEHRCVAKKNENINEGGDTSCRSIQQQMARCISKNASELAERVKAEKKKS